MFATFANKFSKLRNNSMITLIRKNNLSYSGETIQRIYYFLTVDGFVKDILRCWRLFSVLAKLWDLKSLYKILIGGFG